ncbi:MAG: amidase family protein [Hyphomicrobiales bacterium]
MAEGTQAAAKLLEGLGHNVEEARFEVSGDEFWHHFWAVWSVWLMGILDEAKKKAGRDLDDGDFEPWTRAVGALMGTKHSMEDVEKALGYFTELGTNHRAFLQEYDIALTPVVSEPPQVHGAQDPRVGDFEAMSKILTDYVNFTALHNATGVPSVSLPVAWAKNGLPLGTLFSADYGQEAKLLHLAYEVEEAAPWANRRPPHGAF